MQKPKEQVTAETEGKTSKKGNDLLFFYVT